MVVGEFTQETDLVVIGGGPAGYAAAFRAAELGHKTFVVDARDGLGGTCLHAGCIGSKTLVHIADTIDSARRAADLGVQLGSPRIDLDQVRAWTQGTIERLAQGLEGLCRKHGVQRVRGMAHFADSRHVDIPQGEVSRLKFKRAIIATGCRSRAHGDLPFDGLRVLTPAQALELPDVSGDVLVLGHDYMALELAGVYGALGSRVTLIGQNEQLLPQADADLVRPVVRALEQRIEGVHLAASVTDATVTDTGVEISLDGSTRRFDRAIVCQGLEACTESLQLQHTKVALDKDGFIPVDERTRTTDQRIHAAGDVTGDPLLADRALHQGRIAAEVIAGLDVIDDPRAVPVVVFTDPQIAWCGLTETAAKLEGTAHAVARLPWGASGRAAGMGRTDGVTKMIYDPDSKLVLGIGLTGAHASEMIGQCALAIEMGAVTDDLAATVHPHPTMCELLADVARSIDSR
jgi:dihydrolipoamide dehydrogenase